MYRILLTTSKNGHLKALFIIIVSISRNCENELNWMKTGQRFFDSNIGHYVSSYQSNQIHRQWFCDASFYNSRLKYNMKF